MTQTLVAILCAAVAVALTGWDVVLVADSVDGNTISETLRRASYEWPLLAYLWGLLGAHFFLGHGPAIFSPRFDFWIVIWSMFLGLILNFAYRDTAAEMTLWGFVAVLVAGTLIGHFFWSQTL